MLSLLAFVRPSMICDPCQQAIHDRCEDNEHPGRQYRSCFCQHRPAQTVRAEIQTGQVPWPRVRRTDP